MGRKYSVLVRARGFYLSDLALLCCSKEGAVEGEEGRVVGSAGQMHGVGEVKSESEQLQRALHDSSVSNSHIRQAEQALHRIMDHRPVEPLGASENPFRLEKYGGGDVRLRTLQNHTSLLGLKFIVPSQIPDDDVRVDSDHTKLVLAPGSPLSNFVGNCLIHFLDGLRRAIPFQIAEHIFVPSLGKSFYGLEQDTFWGLVNGKLCSGSPPASIPDGLGQNQLSFCG